MDMGDRKKPAPDFVIRLAGIDIRPWRVPMRNLSRVMDAVQRLVEQQEEDDSVSPATTISRQGLELNEDRVLRLIDIKSGSAAYKVSVPNAQPALKLIGETGVAIKEPENFGWTQPTLSSLKDLSEVASSLGCIIELRLPGDKRGTFGDVLATITPSTFATVEVSAYIKGDTSVYASVERVGGATEMRCGIRLPSQPRKMVVCRVDGEELVRRLGQYIYQDIVLNGSATWLRHTGELKTMVIHNIEPPKSGSISDALRKIHDAGGDAWDAIPDPDAVFAELRQA